MALLSAILPGLMNSMFSDVKSSSSSYLLRLPSKCRMTSCIYEDDVTRVTMTVRLPDSDVRTQFLGYFAPAGRSYKTCVWTIRASATVSELRPMQAAVIDEASSPTRTGFVRIVQLSRLNLLTAVGRLIGPGNRASDK